MNNETIIRRYQETDFGEMLLIFNRFARESFAVYGELELEEDHYKKMMELAKIILVLCMNDKVIGFGYISAYKPYPNFNRTGVLTYFILPEFTGKGFGTKLFNELISQGKQIGITNYLAHISSKNEQSLLFHKKHGFTEVGRFKNIAVKFGHPIDVVWVQKDFGEA